MDYLDKMNLSELRRHLAELKADEANTPCRALSDHRELIAVVTRRIAAREAEEMSGVGLARFKARYGGRK